MFLEVKMIEQNLCSNNKEKKIQHIFHVMLIVKPEKDHTQNRLILTNTLLSQKFIS